MSKFVAVEINGVIEVHLPGAFSDYDTLCGIDSHDDVIGHYPAKKPAGKKCDCTQCRDAWELSNRYKRNDFEW